MSDTLDALQKARERREQDRVAKAQIEAARLQAETARLQNEILRQQLENEQADRFSTELAALHAKWKLLVEEELTHPVSDRYPPHLLSRVAINDVTRELGRAPLDRSIEAFRRQIGVR